MSKSQTMHEQWLTELTSLPTAAGREAAVVAWVEHWAAQRKGVKLRRDRFGNLLLALERKGRRKAGSPPIFYTAHLDHPAFVVTQVISDRELLADFRGGVGDGYFNGARVALYHDSEAPQKGRVVELTPAQGRYHDKSARIRFARKVTAAPGDVLMWDFAKPRVKRVKQDRQLHTRACDDLAGVAAALAAFDTVRASRRAAKPDLRVLLTRSEEVGFIGAMAACESGIIPADVLLITLECSKSIPGQSPIGAGPIVRVGDRTSTFDPDLTYRLSHLANELATTDPTFKAQRHLMPGGTCEASAFQAFGYTASCVCLALGNYHNQNELTGKVGQEFISLSDFHGLVRLLTEAGLTLNDPGKAPSLKTRLDDLLAARRHLVESPV